MTSNFPNVHVPMDLNLDFEGHAMPYYPSSGVDAVNHFIETVAPNAAGGSSSSFSPASSSNAKKRKRISENKLFTQTGASILSQSGKNRQSSLVMKFGGKREHPDLITPFLKNLSGSGTVSTEWSGIIKAALNVRTSFLTFFRHNMSFYAANAGFTSSSAYDNGIIANILLPASPTIAIAGTSGLVTGSAYVHADQQCYFVPLNRPDYEDMSWNLNKLKLLPAGAQSTYADAGNSMSKQFLGNVGLLGVDKHRRIGAMHINNALPPTTTTEAPYRYNMVFNYGEADYLFSNKGIFAAEVEIILYRIKKNTSVSSNPVDSGIETRMSITLPYTQLGDPIGAGYVKSIHDKYGTDKLGGRVPSVSDVAINPRVTLMPKTKAIIQSNLPYAEVVRKKFTLPCGARKSVKINLPGAVYDPTSIKSTVGFGDDPTASTGLRSAEYYAQLDDHTFAILIAVNGVVQTTNFHKDPEISTNVAQNAVDVPFLDCYGPSDVQYYCTYSEHLAACQYKAPVNKKIFVNGAGVYNKFSGDDSVDTEAICLIPADQVMRTPRKVTMTLNTDGTTTTSGFNMDNAGANQGAGV